TVRVKTSDKDKWERRYKVWLELLHNGVSRRVHVSLNDRKHMEYQLLIGRNYLRGRFLVDVAEKRTPLTADGAASEKEEKEGLRTADEDSTGTDEPAES
ncbi:MAG: RimK/LysX family protein, partial [Planctomycetota bacterium]